MRFRRWWFLSAAVVALGPATLAAQKPIKIGPMLGFNQAKIRVSDLEQIVEINRRTGLVVGGFASFEVSPRFAIQPELLYSQQGAAFPIDDLVSGVLKLDYVQLPVLAQLRFPSGKTVPFLIAGPSIGVKASCKIKADFGSISGGFNSAELPCQDPESGFVPFKSTDVSGIFGVGVEISGLSISARYTQGFSNINGSASDLEKIRNRVISLNVGYGFKAR